MDNIAGDAVRNFRTCSYKRRSWYVMGRFDGSGKPNASISSSACNCSAAPCAGVAGGFKAGIGSRPRGEASASSMIF
jgi:hypothetical protein